MTSPANESLTRLMFSEESGLVRVDKGKVASEHERKVAAHPYQGRLRRLVQEASEFGADYVYFRLHPDAGSPRAEVFIFDRTGATASIHDLGELQLQLWNYGQVPLMFVLRRDGVHIHSLLAKPELEAVGSRELPPYEKLNLAADAVAEIEAAKWNRFHAQRFDNGTFWEGNPLLKDAATSIKSLVAEVRAARLEIERRTAEWPDKELAKRLMIFVIMIRFLEEKGILSEAYFQNVNAGATRFEHIVAIPGALARILGMLEHDLNGDVFRLRDGRDGDLSEREKIIKLTVEQLAPIADFATGRVSNKQQHLWALYRFDHLPVEAMSYIYEDFLGGEENAYYTPHLLAELLLDEAMEPQRVEEALRDWTLNKAAPYRLIDPTCGSGVFLVGAWRRLVEGWRVLHPDEAPSIEVLSALMKQNVFGVDIKNEAIDLTCFSLSVALCAELMRDLHGDGDAVFELLRKHKLPSLKADLEGSNLFGGEDFFEHLRVGLPHEGAYTLVIGNPPFDASLSPKSKWLLEDSTRGQDEKAPWPKGIPNNQICYLFLREAPRLLKEGGLACLIQKDAFLYNLGPEDFRAALFRNWRVPQILDFISIRHLFDAAKAGGGKVDTKVVAVFIEAKPPQENEVVTHVTFRKVSAVEQRLFFEVDAYDVHRVPVAVAANEPKIWKANLLGGGRLLQTYHAVKGSRTIESFLESKGCIDRRSDIRSLEERKAKPDIDYDGQSVPDQWFCSEGLKGDGINKAHFRPTRKGRSCVDTKEFTTTCTTPPVIPLEHEHYDAPRDYAIFCAPHLLIKKHETLPSFARLEPSSEPLYFRNQIVGIACPPKEKESLRSLATFIDRERLSLTFFAAFGAQSLINKTSALLKQDIMELPYPEDGRLLFRGIEPSLRDDVLKHMIPLIKHGTGKDETAHLVKSADDPQLQAFSRTLIKVLRNTWKEFAVAETVDMGIAWCMAYSLNGTPAEVTWTKEAISTRLNSLLEHPSSVRLRFRRVVRMFDGETLYLIKPKDYRYWLQSIAVRDADEVVGLLMSEAVRRSSVTEVPA